MCFFGMDSYHIHIKGKGDGDGDEERNQNCSSVLFLFHLDDFKDYLKRDWEYPVSYDMEYSFIRFSNLQVK